MHGGAAKPGRRGVPEGVEDEAQFELLGSGRAVATKDSLALPKAGDAPPAPNTAHAVDQVERLALIRLGAHGVDLAEAGAR